MEIIQGRLCLDLSAHGVDEVWGSALDSAQGDGGGVAGGGGGGGRGHPVQEEARLPARIEKKLNIYRQVTNALIGK